MEKIVIIENVIEQQENSLNLLRCFLDFLENEVPEIDMTDEKKTLVSAACFSNRLPQYYSMLNVISDLMIKNKNELENLLKEG